jgi:hypothetical protein
MKESRRRWLIAGVSALSFVTVKPAFSCPQTPGGTRPKPHPYPNGRDPNYDSSIDEPTRLDAKGIAQENQKKLRADVAALYEMAAELKSEVEKTDSNSTLSLSLMKKAQQIEKLAKEIKNLARN